MVVRASNSEIMDMFKKIDSINLNKDLSEKEIAKQVKACKETIVKKLSFLVYSHTRYYKRFPNYEDLVQEGFVGLITAINKFKWEMFPNFFAYSDQWIRHKVKKGASRFDVVYNPDKSRVIYAEPDESEIDSSGSPEEMLFNKERSDCIKEVLCDFSERERQIVQKIFGLEGKLPETLREIGPQFNLTHERVRQIKNRVIDRLRKNNDPRLQEIKSKISERI